MFKREAAVTRSIEFTVRFIIQADQASEGILNKFIDYLLGFHGAKDKAVRYRVCQIVGKILDALPEDVEIDEETFDVIEKVGMIRMTDKVPVVRVQACTLLTRLQDPTDDEDPVTELYLRAISTDSSPDVRKSVLSQLAPSKKTIPAVLTATRDKAPVVRKEAYKYVKLQIDVKALTVEQRLKLLSEGLKDRTADVRAECVKMLCESWYDSTSRKDKLAPTVETLERLDVCNDTKTCEMVVAEVIKYVRDWRLAANDFEELNCEKALLWRVFAEHYSAAKKHDELDELLLPVTGFGEVVQKWAEKCAESKDFDEKLDAQFITEQLLQLAMVLDYSDEAGRRNMAKCLQEVLQLTMVPPSVVEKAMALSKILHPDEGERVRVIVETIAEIRQPIQARESSSVKAQKRAKALETSKLTVKLTELRIQIDELVKAEKFTEAGSVKAEIKELEARKAELTAKPVDEDAPMAAPKDDVETWSTCLTIATMLLKTTTLTMRNPSLNGMILKLIIPAVQNADPEVRNNALSALGMACLRNGSPALAQEHLKMFLIVLQLDQDVIKQTVLRTLFDFVLLFGADAFTAAVNSADGSCAAADDSSSSNNGEGQLATAEAAEGGEMTVMKLLQKYLHDSDEQLRTIAVEGVCKLFLLNHVTRAGLFSELILLFFSPMTADDERLRQCLSLFFPAFAFSSTSHAMIVEEAFMPTIRRILCAPKASPLHTVKPLGVIKFFVYHTSQSEGAGRTEGEGLVHESLAIKVMNEMLSCPNTAEMKALSPTLALFDVASFTSLTINSLQHLLEQLAGGITTKTEQKKLAQFEAKLAEVSSGGGDGLSEEQIAELQATQAKHQASRGTNVDELYAAAGVSVVAKRSSRARASKAKSNTAKTFERESDSGSEEDEEIDFSNDEGGPDVAPGTPVAVAPRPDRTCKTPAKTVIPVDSDEGSAEGGDESDDEEKEPVYIVETILDHRTKRRAVEYLVKWEGFGEGDNTWEPAKNLAVELIEAYTNANIDAENAIKSENIAPKKGNKGRAKPSKKTLKKAKEAAAVGKQSVEAAEESIDELLDDVPTKAAVVVRKRTSRKAVLKQINAEEDDELDELLA